MYAINTLHHLEDRKSQIDTMQELLRVTKVGGLVFIHEMNIRNPIIRLYLNYIFPKLRNIDEGNEIWIKSTFFQEIKGIKILDTRFYNFIPDFTPKFLFGIVIRMGLLLENSFLRKYSANYCIVIQKL